MGMSSPRASEGKGPELVGVASFGACAPDLAAPALAADAFPVGIGSSTGGAVSTCHVALAVG